MDVDWNEVVSKLARKIAQLEVELAVLQAAVDKYHLLNEGQEPEE